MDNHYDECVPPHSAVRLSRQLQIDFTSEVNVVVMPSVLTKHLRITETSHCWCSSGQAHLHPNTMRGVKIFRLFGVRVIYPYPAHMVSVAMRYPTMTPSFSEACAVAKQCEKFLCTLRKPLLCDGQHEAEMETPPHACLINPQPYKNILRRIGYYP